jgi:transcription initiation factor TFIIIB Brf1 subunit/transcription initiation factor TFIIB
VQTVDPEASCPECLIPLVDVVDELVCSNCGLVKGKETLEPGPGNVSFERLAGRRSLGSYLGSMVVTQGERASKGLSGSNSKYGYLKTLSDFAGRGERAPETCDRIIGRVSEKLFLPRFVTIQASAIAKTILSARQEGRRVTIAAVSAYSLITACKMRSVASVSVREILEAHVALGRRVTSSSMIQLALGSSFKTYARRPEDYISRVLAWLSRSPTLSNRLSSGGVSQTSYFISLRETAKEVLRAADTNEMTGKRPCALAAAAVYSAEVVLSACESRKKRLTQKELAQAGDTAEYTIREQCARILAQSVKLVIARRKQTSLPAFAR